MRKLLVLLLWVGALFYFTEFFFHFFGLEILEHDKIFLFTHDRYIAIFALTYAALLLLIATNIPRYKYLFFITMSGILFSMLNGWMISQEGGYAELFDVQNLDQGVGYIGIGAMIWYLTTWIVWMFHRKTSHD